MATIKITKQEMWDLGFEKVVIDGVEYVDKGPLIMDSTCPLSLAYYELIEKKKREFFRKQRLMKKRQKLKERGEAGVKK